MKTNQITINRDAVLSENLEQNISNEEKISAKKNKEYWKKYNQSPNRKEKQKLLMRERRALAKSLANQVANWKENVANKTKENKSEVANNCQVANIANENELRVA